jgi:transcriptional regulator with PAS, ATPase and Fis domain
MMAAPRSPKEGYHFEEIVGKSPDMQRIFRLIGDISHSDATVLVQGESGTGKEIVARAIHRRSGRAHRPFITANCAAIPETLLESELFGYEKGAFTGAQISRKGRFELAEGGTLLLDEVTEMKPSAQVDLLRVLQEKEFRRVGGSRLIDSDVRIIASSNKDVEEEVEHGNFREDLYYRLNVIPVHVPPLRVRKEDIPLLIDHFLKKHLREAKRKIRGVSEKTIELLVSYDWPGNVRELENVIQRAMVLGKKEHLVSDDLPDKIRRFGRYHNEVCYPLGSTLEDVEKNYIHGVLRSTRWNVSEAARMLKINRMTLYNKMRKYGFRRHSRA